MKYKRWVRAEVVIIKQCAGSMTVERIGQLIGRTGAAVRTKAGNYHQSVKYLQEDIELARELHQSGINRQDIAEKLEMPIGAVNQFVYFERRIS